MTNFKRSSSVNISGSSLQEHLDGITDHDVKIIESLPKVGK